MGCSQLPLAHPGRFVTADESLSTTSISEPYMKNPKMSMALYSCQVRHVNRRPEIYVDWGTLEIFRV